MHKSLSGGTDWEGINGLWGTADLGAEAGVQKSEPASVKRQAQLQ